MKKSALRSFMIIFALSIIVLTISSCNRGIGCPSDFSLDVAIPIVIDLVK